MDEIATARVGLTRTGDSGLGLEAGYGQSRVRPKYTFEASIQGKYNYHELKSLIETSPDMPAIQNWCMQANTALKIKNMAFFAKYGIVYENNQFKSQEGLLRLEYSGQKYATLFLQGSIQETTLKTTRLVEMGIKKRIGQQDIYSVTSIVYEPGVGFRPKIGVTTTF